MPLCVGDVFRAVDLPLGLGPSLHRLDGRYRVFVGFPGTMASSDSWCVPTAALGSSPSAFACQTPLPTRAGTRSPGSPRDVSERTRALGPPEGRDLHPRAIPPRGLPLRNGVSSHRARQWFEALSPGPPCASHASPVGRPRRAGVWASRGGLSRGGTCSTRRCRRVSLTCSLRRFPPAQLPPRLPPRKRNLRARLDVTIRRLVAARFSILLHPGRYSPRWEGNVGRGGAFGEFRLGHLPVAVPPRIGPGHSRSRRRRTLGC